MSDEQPTTDYTALSVEFTTLLRQRGLDLPDPTRFSLDGPERNYVIPFCISGDAYRRAIRQGSEAVAALLQSEAVRVVGRCHEIAGFRPLSMSKIYDGSILGSPVEDLHFTIGGFNPNVSLPE